MTLETLLIAIPALPLAAAVLTAALGPKVLRERSHWPTIVALVVAFVLSAVLAIDVWRAAEQSTDSIGYEKVVNVWTWANLGGAQVDGPSGTSLDLNIAIALRADTLTAMMMVMVTFVASLVAIYAAGYMHGDRGYWRFFSFVSLFAFSMLMLVSVSNFVLLYVFWEAVGVCSYFLIGFWYEKCEAAAAGKKAFLVNRVGDFGFALALFLIWTTYGTLNFHDTLQDGTPLVADNGVDVEVPGVLGQYRLANNAYVGAQASTDEAGGGPTVALAICLLLMLGACGKSAQFPLHVWLPDAMEGPTPVSALIHAATMVTAGVYMVTRCTPLFMVSAEAQLVVAVIGGFTALLAGIIAFTQTDLKRVLAYSTISQLGYMFLALGTGSLAGIVAGMFHLFTHAFFKALLFLGAGSVMHAMGGVIDVRRFGGLRRLMPVTHVTFLVGALALAGVVPFAGFWSKDAIVAAVHERGHHGGPYLWLFYAALFTAFLTAMYTFRAYFLTFFGREEIPPEAGHHAHESPRSMTVPLVVLALGAATVGFLHQPFADGFLSHTPSLAYETVAKTGPAYPGFHWDVAAISTVVALLGIALAAFFYLGERKEVEWLSRRLLIKPLYLLSHGKFFFDQIYTLLVVWPLVALAWLAYWLDRYLIDGLVNLCGKVPVIFGAVFRSLQPGLVQYYAMLMIMGLALLVLLESLLL